MQPRMQGGAAAAVLAWVVGLLNLKPQRSITLHSKSTTLRSGRLLREPARSTGDALLSVTPTRRLNVIRQL